MTRDRVSGDTLPDGANFDLTAVQRRRRASYFTQAAQQPDEMSGRCWNDVPALIMHSCGSHHAQLRRNACTAFRAC